ncbi:GH25 family lysozyme [Fructobacillus tropaeoli]|uniref:Lysozyme n=1 Tax=Fructobacillus tropaeoli TaxID=709323 RepID=A0A3F3HDQ7_9LACO|nr:GH25 family lysozyme [Fructobacillus tropaeoli]GAP04079.1 cell wall-binding repeat protein [Fructobacillus tropaeoli]
MNVKNTFLTLAAATAFGAVVDVSHHLVAQADSVAAVTAGQTGLPRMDVVDVSSYQGYLTAQDYVTMRNNGVKGIIVKLTEGTTYKNPYAQDQVNNARAAGLTVSAYHYSDFNTPDGGRAEANYFADFATQLGFKSTDLLVDDLEDSSTVGGNVSDNARAFNDQLHARGFTNTTLYTYASYKKTNNLDTSIFGGDSKVWIAQYPYNPSGSDVWNTGFGMWQWSSNASFNGISGKFDVSMDYTGMATNGAASGTQTSSTTNNSQSTNTGSNQSTNTTTPTTDTESASDKLVKAIQAAKTSGYLYDGTDQNGGFRWYENGQPYTGFRYYMGTYYWFVNGVRQNDDWRSAWGMTYWTDSNGRAVQGVQTINGKQYYFGNDDTYFVRTNQTVSIDNAQFQADANGVLTPITGYAYDGSDQNGGYRWYENGQLYTGFRYYMGTYYWFVNGVRQNQGWRSAWGLTYWTDNDGRAVQGWQTIDGKSYYFGSNGTYYLR